MKLLKAIGVNIWDLLVEDGSIAIGTVGALVALGLWTLLVARNEDLVSMGGWLLLAMLLVLLVVNLYITGQNAARKRLG